jgi:hypothetical protein
MVFVHPVNEGPGQDLCELAADFAEAVAPGVPD